MKPQFPTSWSTSRFKDVAEVITGTTPSTQCPEYYGGFVPFVGPAELGEAKPITQSSKWLSSAGAKQARLLPAESVLICCIGATIGKVGFSGMELATNQQINALVFNKNIVHARYAFHYCQTLRPLIRHMGASTTLPILPKGRFQEIEIPLPPLEEQRRIAAILDKADAVRRKRQEAIALTEELLRSAFLEMFGDPGKNLHRWTTGYIGDVAEIVTDGTHQTPTRSESGVMLLSARNIKNGYIDVSEDVDFVPQYEYERLRKSYAPKPQDVLISCSGSIGRVTVVRDFGSFSMVRSVAVVRPKLALINSEFLESLLHSAYLRASMVKGAKQSSQANLFQGAIKELPVILPPLSLQEQWQTFKARIRETAKRYLHMKDSQTELFNSLLQGAFRGEL